MSAKRKSRDGKTAAKKPARPGVVARLRRALAAWPRPVRLGAAAALALGVLGGAGVWAVESGTAARLADAAAARALAATRDAGLAVEAVYVDGRKQTDRADILEAVGVDVGDAILGVDTTAVRRRVEALGWVARARVERRLPGTLVVRIAEREAAAIWQRDGEFVLIDRAGAVIGAEDVPRFRHLKVVVGEDAPAHTAELLAMLAREPALEARVAAAVRMGERRWNLRFENGVDVRLPADDPKAAWHKLARLERDHAVLKRAVKAVDLRQADRLIVRMTEEGALEIGRRGREGEET